MGYRFFAARGMYHRVLPQKERNKMYWCISLFACKRNI